MLIQCFNFLKKKISVNLTLVVLGFYFVCQKWAFHFTFKTHFYDLFFYNHSIWNIANTLTPWLAPFKTSFFEDHFYYWLYLIAPIYKLFSPSPIILFIIQSICLCLTAYPILKLAKDKFGVKGEWITLGLLFFYLTFRRAIFDAIHGEVFMMVLISWFIYFMEKMKYKHAFFLSIIFIFTKENAIIFLIPMSILFWIKNKKGYSVSLLCMSLLSFYLIFNFFYDSSESYGFLTSRYNLGTSFSESIFMILKNPVIFFENVFEWSKIRYLILVFLPLGGLSIFSKYIILAIPLLLQNLMSSDYGMYNIVTHYSFPLIPVIFMSGLLAYEKYKSFIINNKSVFQYLKTCSLVFVVLNIGAIIIFDFRHFIITKDILKTRNILNQIANSDDYHVITTPNFIQFFSYTNNVELFRVPQRNESADYVLIANQMKLDRLALDASEYLIFYLNDLKNFKYNTYRWFYGEREYTNYSDIKYKEMKDKWLALDQYTPIIDNSEILILKLNN